VFAIPSVRLEGPHLALATFALAIAVPQLLKYRHLEPLTNGAQGIYLVKPAAPSWLPLSADQWLYLVTLGFAGLMLWLTANLADSRIGRAMMAARDAPLAAEALGIDVVRAKAAAFGIGALCAGLAGALHAIVFEFVSPDSFRFDLSITLFVGAVVGGVSRLSGALIGGAFVQLIDKYADAGSRLVAEWAHLPLVIPPWTVYGLALIGLMYIMPNGIAGGIARRWRRSRHE
jgi:branched-chain amino acid transport system permease protein